MTIRIASRATTLVAMLLPTATFAHTGLHGAGGFEHGFVHPISGLDHILAMVMVGVFSYQLGGRALWLVPSAFVLIMALGGVLGMSGVDVPFVEIGITLSVIVLGAVVAFGVKAPTAALGIVSLFAVFHGYAHGAEMPSDASGLAYSAGFMIATAALHIVGIGIGLMIGRAGEQYSPVIARSAGGFAAVAGVGLLSGIL
jgi:urease accessory protein